MKIKIEEVSNQGVDGEAFKVTIDDHAVNTIVTYCHKVVSQWVKEEADNFRQKNSGDTIVAGVDKFSVEDKKGKRKFLAISTGGTRCLIFCYEPDAKLSMKEIETFFSDHNVVAAGISTSKLVQKMNGLGVKFSRSPVDVNLLSSEFFASQTQKKLANVGVGNLAKVVLGTHFHLNDPSPSTGFCASCQKWLCNRDIGCPILSSEHVKFYCTNAHFLSLLGRKLLSQSTPNPSSSSSSSSSSRGSKINKRSN